MKVIFLDFDGVLNSRHFVSHEGGTFRDRLDPKAILRLNRIVRKVPGVKVVISSTWRLLHTLEWLQKFLKEQGFEGEVIDATPRAGMDYGTTAETGLKYAMANGRGEEILAWLKDHPSVKTYIALDDDSYGMGPVLSQLVKTTFEWGLQPEHVEEAVEKLTAV